MSAIAGEVVRALAAVLDAGLSSGVVAHVVRAMSDDDLAALADEAIGRREACECEGLTCDADGPCPCLPDGADASDEACSCECDTTGGPGSTCPGCSARIVTTREYEQREAARRLATCETALLEVQRHLAEERIAAGLLRRERARVEEQRDAARGWARRWKAAAKAARVELALLRAPPLIEAAKDWMFGPGDDVLDAGGSVEQAQRAELADLRLRLRGVEAQRDELRTAMDGASCGVGNLAGAGGLERVIALARGEADQGTPCGCGGRRWWQPERRGETVGGLEVAGADVCDRCGVSMLVHGLTRPAGRDWGTKTRAELPPGATEQTAEGERTPGATRRELAAALDAREAREAEALTKENERAEDVWLELHRLRGDMFATLASGANVLLGGRAPRVDVLALVEACRLAAPTKAVAPNNGVNAAGWRLTAKARGILESPPAVGLADLAALLWAHNQAEAKRARSAERRKKREERREASEAEALTKEKERAEDVWLELHRFAFGLLALLIVLLAAACGGIAVVDVGGAGGVAGQGGQGGGATCAPAPCELVPEDPVAACPPGWTGVVLLCLESVPQGCAAVGLGPPLCAAGEELPAGALLACCCAGWGGPGYDCGTGGEGGAS